MDKTLETILREANRILDKKLTLTKEKSKYIISKDSWQFECNNKQSLIGNILVEVHAQGKLRAKADFKRALGL